MIESIEVVVADKHELVAAQSFYQARGYGGASIEPTDFVVLAKLDRQIIGIGRLCQEKDLLWLRGMQVEPNFQRSGIGSHILQLLSKEIGTRWCCCLPYSHLIGFYQQIGFEAAEKNLPFDLTSRLENYLSHGLHVTAMVRAAR